MMINAIKNFFLLSLAFLISNSISGQTQTMGVDIYDKDNTSDGYVFFSPGKYSDAYLIDNCGFLVNSWERSNWPGLSGYLTESGLMLRTNKVNNPEFGQASTGGNLELVDWDNNTIWSSDFNEFEYIQHHDARLLPNGNIIYIGWERISPQQQLEYGRRPNEVSNPYLWGEFIQEIKPIGSSNYEVVWEWHLQDHFVQDYNASLSNYGSVKDEIGKVDINYYGPGAWDDDDWWHCNALDYNPSLDHILVNSRNINELWIIDHSTSTQEAAGETGGNSNKGGELLYRWGNPQTYDSGNSSNLRMYGSHGHYWIPEGMPNAGKIMYFNNGDDRPQGYYSTVEMIDPQFIGGEYLKNSNNVYLPNEPEVVYKAPNPFSFVSTYLSNAQQLANGHVFINEGENGRLFEIDNNDNIVWQYTNPVDYFGPNMQGDNLTVNSIFRAYKYPPDYPAFDGVDLTPGELIEGDSQFNKCKPVSTEEQNIIAGIDVKYDLNSSILTIENQLGENLKLQIISIDGKNLKSESLAGSVYEVNLNYLDSGVYVIVVSTSSGEKSITRKIVRF